MLVQSEVKIRRVPAGAVFINEDGEETRHIGFMVMRQIGAILEAAAGEVVISFEVEVLPELAEPVDSNMFAREQLVNSV